MAGDSTGKVKSGDPFKPPPAVIWNGMIDAGLAFAGDQLSSGAPPPTRSRATDLLKLKNSSGLVRRKGEILKIDDKVIETVTDENIWLDGIEPTGDCRFGILKEPADIYDVVTAQVSGVCMALVNVTDEDHEFAFAADEEYVLQSGDSGPLEILWAPDGETGELDCVVRFIGDASSLKVVCITAEASGGGAPGHFYKGVAAPFICNGKLDGTGTEYEVYWSYQRGVNFTGQIILIEKLPAPESINGGATAKRWEVARCGQVQWPLSAIAEGDIVLGSGEARLIYDRDSVGTNEIVVPIVWFDNTFNVADQSQIMVWWDELTMQFVGSPAACPPEV